MNQRHMHSVPSWIWEFCLQDSARSGVRASAILNQLLRKGLEAHVAEQAAADRALRTVEAIKAIVP